MQPGDRVEVRVLQETVMAGVITRIREHGWSEHITVWVHFDNGDVMAYAPEELRLIEGENA